MNKSKNSANRARNWIIGGVVGLVVLAGGSYVAAHFVAGDQVPVHASVEGVAIGGLSPDEAEQKLREELGPRYAETVTVKAPTGVIARIEPLDSVLELHFDQAIRDAGGGSSWNPGDIVNSLRGGREVELPRTWDDEALEEVFAAFEDGFVVDPIDATLAFEDAKVARTQAVNGARLNLDGTVEKVVLAIEDHQRVVDAVLDETEPDVTDAMVDDAIKNFAGPAVSGPVTITVGDESFEISPEQIAEVTTLTFQGGEFKSDVDVDLLFELTEDARSGLDLKQTKDATYKLVGGAMTVVPAVDGETVDPQGLVDALTEAATKQGSERTAEVATVTEKAAFTTEMAEAVVPREVIGEFTTRYPHAAYRNTNLGRAAETVNGTVLLPGDTFSLNDTLGPRNRSNGYVDGYVINGGVLVKESGGGISQSATTLYNAAFFAGLEDVEHKPHSLYFDRYPAGREATVYYGSVDLKFRNDTEYPVYIQGFISPSSSGNRGSITFKMWSIPTWDKVESTDLVKSNFYTGATRTLKTANCEPQAPIRGFSVSYSRLFYKDGAVAKKQDYFWKYSAGDRIICE